MPTYHVGMPDGRTFEVESDQPLSDEDVYLHAVKSFTPDRNDSLLGTAKDLVVNGFKQGAVPLFEAIGRPAEAVQGMVAGTMKGGLGEGARRAGAAFFEPNFVDSKIQENTANTLAENNILDHHPYVRAGIGFTGDVLTDPLSLLGGAGVVRKGLLKGASKLGVADNVAHQALGLGVADVMKKTVIPAGREAFLTGASKIPGVESVLPNIKLKLIKDATGRTAEDVQYLNHAKKGAEQQNYRNIVGEIAHSHKLTGTDASDIWMAISDPNSVEAARVLASPALRAAKAESEQLLEHLHQRALGVGLINKTKPVFNPHQVSSGAFQITPELSAKLNALSAPEKRAMQRAFASTTDAKGFTDHAALNSTLAGNPNLQALANTLKTQALHDGLPSIDLRTLHWRKDTNTPGALLDAMVDTRRPNYAPHVYELEQTATKRIPISETFNPWMGAAKLRDRSLREALDSGVVTNIGEAMERRAMDGLNAEYNQKLVQDWTKGFAKNTPEDGYRVLDPTHVERLPTSLKNGVLGKYFPEDLAAHIEGASARLSDVKGLETVWDRGIKLFRTMATSLNIPGHQTTNFLGNVTNMYASGMPVDDIVKGVAQSTRALKGKGALPPVMRNGQIWMTSDDVLRAARDHSTIGEFSGFAGEFSKEAEHLTPTARNLFGQEGNPLAVFNPDNALYKKARNINQEWIEDPAKLALFDWHLRQGRSVEEAVLATKSVLFDYADLSDFEKKYMRAIVPFYTWTRKNIPLQVANMLQRPAKLSNQKRLMDLAWELAKHDDVQDVPKDALPDYYKTGEALPIPGQQGKEGLPVFTRPRLPMLDLNMLTTDTTDLAKKGGFMLSPPLRMAIEALQNHKMGDPDYLTLNGRPVPAGLIGRLLGGAAGAWQDPNGQWTQTAKAKWVQGAVPVPLGSSVRTVDSMQSDQTNMNPLLEYLMRSFGMTPQNLTEGALRHAKAVKTMEGSDE